MTTNWYKAFCSPLLLRLPPAAGRHWSLARQVAPPEQWRLTFERSHHIQSKNQTLHLQYRYSNYHTSTDQAVSTSKPKVSVCSAVLFDWVGHKQWATAASCRSSTTAAMAFDSTHLWQVVVKRMCDVFTALIVNPTVKAEENPSYPKVCGPKSGMCQCALSMVISVPWVRDCANDHGHGFIRCNRPQNSWCHGAPAASSLSNAQLHTATCVRISTCNVRQFSFEVSESSCTLFVAALPLWPNCLHTARSATATLPARWSHPVATHRTCELANGWYVQGHQTSVEG